MAITITRTSPMRTADLGSIIVNACAGVALFIATQVPWVGSGPGSTLSGLDLADQLTHGVISPGWGVTVGAAVYACAIFGAMVVASSPIPVWQVSLLRGFIALSMLVILGGASLRGWFPVSLWGPGPRVTVVALAAMLGVNVHAVVARHRKGAPS